MPDISLFTWSEYDIVETTWLVLSNDQFKTTPSRKLSQLACVFGPPGAAGADGVDGALADGVVINGGNF